MLRKLWFNIVYLGKPIWDTGVSPQELTDFLAAHTPARALDLGCGTGTNVVTIARHGWEVTGVDLSSQAIRKARRKVRTAGVQADLRVADVTQLSEISGTFDLIFDLGCFHSLPAYQRPAYLANIDRLLANSGRLLLYAFIRPSPEGVLPGVTETEIQHIGQTFLILARADGTERCLFPSAWLTIGKRSQS